MVVFADRGQAACGAKGALRLKKSLFPSQKESTNPCGWYFLF